jgi:hypothetical protein
MKEQYLMLLLTLISISACQAVYAQPTRAKSQKISTVAAWEKEPDSFMGIKFGKSLRDQLPKCADDHFVNYGSNQPLCWYERSPIVGDYSLELDHKPDLGGIGYSTSLLMVNDSFEGMILTFNQAYFYKMWHLFKDRYGIPTYIEETSLQTRGGMAFKGKVLLWAGSNVTIIFHEYGNKIDEGYVYIATKAYEKNLDEENEKQSQLNKDKL